MTITVSCAWATADALCFSMQRNRNSRPCCAEHARGKFSGRWGGFYLKVGDAARHLWHRVERWRTWNRRLLHVVEARALADGRNVSGCGECARESKCRCPHPWSHFGRDSDNGCVQVSNEYKTCAMKRESVMCGRSPKGCVHVRMDVRKGAGRRTT